MEAEQNSAASPFSEEDARAAGAYLAKDDTYATLLAAAALAGPKRAKLPGVLTDRSFALAIGQFVLAAEQRAGLMRELADQLDAAATMSRAALMGRRDYARLMQQADVTASAT